MYKRQIVASSVAAIARYPSPLVMVDMGTATSLSLIVGSVYEGCSIMPGLAPVSYTHLLIPIPIRLDSNFPAKILLHLAQHAISLLLKQSG